MESNLILLYSFELTGYDFKYPFLSVDTGITIDNNYVQPLYKQIINIEHPTMIFIGVPFTTITTRMMDLQVNYSSLYYNTIFRFKFKRIYAIKLGAICYEIPIGRQKTTNKNRHVERFE